MQRLRATTPMRLPTGQCWRRRASRTPHRQCGAWRVTQVDLLSKPGSGRAALAVSHVLAGRTHLRMSLGEEVIEAFDADEAEPRIFHVGDHVERDGQRSREDD